MSGCNSSASVCPTVAALPGAIDYSPNHGAALSACLLANTWQSSYLQSVPINLPINPAVFVSRNYRTATAPAHPEGQRLAGSFAHLCPVAALGS